VGLSEPHDKAERVRLSVCYYPDETADIAIGGAETAFHM
jgi:hypothetical protein